MYIIAGGIFLAAVIVSLIIRGIKRDRNKLIEMGLSFIREDLLPFLDRKIPNG